VLPYTYMSIYTVKSYKRGTYLMCKVYTPY